MTKIYRTTLFACLAAFCAAFCAHAPSPCRAADMVRFVQKNKESGEYEEGTRSGTVKAITPDAVEFEYEVKGEKKTYSLPSEQVVWLQFDSEPLEMATARVEAEVGNYAEALAKLNAVEDAPKDEFAAAELKWERASATLNLALSDGTDLAPGVKAMQEFVDSEPNSYRLYDADALLGDAYLARSDAAKASERYGALLAAKSTAVQARGKVGQASAALLGGDAEKAEALYREVAEDESLDAQLAGLDARIDARLGLARALVGKKDCQGAVAALNELLAATPNSATLRQARIYNELGDAYAAWGKAQEAIVAYLHVDLLYPAARAERVRALKALVPLWRETGRLDRASETRRTLEERFGVKAE